MNEEKKYFARCFRCKEQKEVKNPEIVTMKTGMKAVKGTCVVCGCKQYKILPKDKS